MLSLDTFNSGGEKCSDKCRHEHFHFSTYNEGECPVCLDDTEEPDTMLLPCAHAFHGDCILRWVENNFSCPMCRTEIGQFLPMIGTPIKEEFSELWNKHYVEGNQHRSAAISEPEDDLVKKSTQQTKFLPITLEELELLFEDDKEIQIVDQKAEAIEQAQDDDKKNYFSFFDHNEEDPLIFNSLPFFTERNSLIIPALISSREKRWFIWGSLRNSLNPFYRPPQPVTEPELEKYQYTTIDNFRGGASSGVLTTVVRMLVERQAIRNFFPIFREVTPNVAIYFTVFEETKKYLGRPSDSYGDIFNQCFASGCVGGFCAYLPRTHFTALVPIQFGLHFATFEVLKQAIRNHTGKERLTVGDVASTAVTGGIVGSCVTYPLSKLLTNASLMMEGGQRVALTHNLTHNFFGHVVRMSPLWATTACGFEFSRRFITNT